MKKVYLSPSSQDDNIGYGDYGTEKSRMIQLVELVKYQLEKKFDIKVANNNSTLASRVTEANNWKADIYVAFHTNAGGARGCEVYAYSEESKGKKLAQLLYNNISKITPSSDRGIKYNSLYETKMPNAPACLIEFIFHDNKEDVNWFLNNMNQVSIEVSKAIFEYFDMKYEVNNEKEIDSNNKIFEIQKELNSKYKLGLKVDGIYGSETKKALIKALQIELNKQFNKKLNIDGIFGEKTKNAGVNVKLGDRGNITWCIQAMLICKKYNLELDGIYGESTEIVVKKFQKDSNIQVDGIVGKDTFSKLFS